MFQFVKEIKGEETDENNYEKENEIDKPFPYAEKKTENSRDVPIPYAEKKTEDSKDHEKSAQDYAMSQFLSSMNID